MDRAHAEIQLAHAREEIARLRAENEQLVSTLDAANDGIITIQAVLDEAVQQERAMRAYEKVPFEPGNS